MELAKVKIYILAQGQGSRWMVDDGRNMSIELPSEYKQLTPLGNETIITRTIRQIREALGGTITVDVELIAPGDFLGYPLNENINFRSFREPTGCILEGICKTKNEWSGHRVVFLLGDVIYSNRMIKEIMSNSDTISLFGRKEANPITNKCAGEIFAFGFDAAKEIQSYIWHQMRKLWFHNNLNNAKLWTLYNFVDKEIPLHEIDNDYTDDIDSPEEYAQFYEKLKEYALEDDVRRK